MLTEQEVLDTLDNCQNEYDSSFVQLGHPYVYPIDSRINIFRNNQGKWALAIEIMGYDVNAAPMALEITYYGNCLFNLDFRNDYFSNTHCTLPISEESYSKTIRYGKLNHDADFWVIRGQEVKLSHLKKDYADAGIKLKAYEPDEISAEEVGRFLVTKHRDLFRATDEELYKSIPHDLEKILVINEWYHRDFYQNDAELPESLQLPDAIQGFDLSQFFRANQSDLEDVNEAKEMLTSITSSLSQYESNRAKQNDDEWNNNRPSSYETWQQIAKVIVTGDMSFYKPTLQPNSHWSNWPDAGTM